MKTIKKALTIILTMVLAAGFGCLSAFAADEETPKDEYGDNVYKATYTITVYSGKEGTFNGETVKTYTAEYGDTITISLDDLGLKINDGSKYYDRGLKVAGHDNDETIGLGYRTIHTKVTGDQSYSVAYGLKGGMVKYTINYLDANGNPLLPSGEYYGMAGDRPVVSYKYIEGFAPAVYNFTRTLVNDESKNVFDFVYSESTLTAAEQAQQAATTGTGTAAGAANAANGGANAGANNADGTAIGDNATPAAGAPNVVDLDDGNTPQAAPQSDLPKSELSRQKRTGYIIGGTCGAAALAAAAYALIRRRQYEYEADDE